LRRETWGENQEGDKVSAGRMGVVKNYPMLVYKNQGKALKKGPEENQRGKWKKGTD